MQGYSKLVAHARLLFVEHVFGEQKARMGLFVRTIGLVRARSKIGMANLVYNMKRLVWLEGRPAPA